MQQYGYLYNKLANDVNQFASGSETGTPAIASTWTWLLIIIAVAVFIGVYRYGT